MMRTSRIGTNPETEGNEGTEDRVSIPAKKAVFVLAVAFARKRDVIALLRNDLDCPMEDTSVERCQFHPMFFGQFGEIQIGKLSARLCGDSSRRKIIWDKPAAALPNELGKSVSAELRLGPKWKCVAAADSQEA